MLINYRAMILWIYQEFTLLNACPLNWAALQWDRLGNVPEATQIQYQNQSVSPLPAPGSVSIATVNPPPPITSQPLPSLCQRQSESQWCYIKATLKIYTVSRGPDITHRCDQQNRLCISAGHYQLLHGMVHFVSLYYTLQHHKGTRDLNLWDQRFCPLTFENDMNADINK